MADTACAPALFLYVLTPLVGLFVNSLIQVLSFRTISDLGLLRSIYLGFIAGLIVALAANAMFIVFFPRIIYYVTLSVITNTLTYTALGYCYFHFVGLSETARRIRMLTEMFGSKEAITIGQILERYNSEEILRNRMGRLLRSGQIRYEGGKYFVGKPIVLLISYAAIFLKLLFLGRRGESNNKGTA